MHQPLPVFWLFAAWALTAATASAQVDSTPGTPAAPASGSANATSTATTHTQAAPVAYQSAFAGYQPFAEEKVLPWKATNGTVEKAGGWRAYAKEAHSPEVSTTAQPPAATSSNPHAAHNHQ